MLVYVVYVIYVNNVICVINVFWGNQGLTIP